MTAPPPARGRYSLTPRQAQLLRFIQSRDICPTFEEMRRGICVKHKSSISALLGRLEERGWIRRLPDRQQAIEVLHPAPVFINGRPYRFIPKSFAASSRGAPVAVTNAPPAALTVTGEGA